MTATTTTYEIHPLAHLLPEMRETEFAELREDIAANGLHEAITLYEGQVLDGRHRYRACTELGLWPTFTKYEGDAPAAYVLSLNVKRRQLTQSQKAMLATDFLPHLREEARTRQAEAGRQFGRGMNSLESEESKLSGPNPGRSAQHAAEQVGVAHAQVIRANRVKRDDPELAERVRAGEITVGAAHEQVVGKSKSSNGDRSWQRPAADMVENLVGKLLGLSNGLEHIDTAAAVAAANGSLTKWDRDLTDIIVPLNRLRGDIRKALSND